MSNKTAVGAKVSSLVTDLFHASLKKYVDYNKPDPIARRQLESWKMIWSKGIDCHVGKERGNAKDSVIGPVKWSPKNYIAGTLEIRGDYVAVKLEMECIWADGDEAERDEMKEDGRLAYTCRLKSGEFIEANDVEDKSQRKIRKKMISRLRQDSYVANLIKVGENDSSSNLCLAQACIYVNSSKFELEERVDVSETAAETLKRALWSSTPSSLDVVELMLALPSLPCRNSDSVTTTTRLANRAKLRLLEDAMLDECEKEGDDQLIEDLTISKENDTCEGYQKESAHSKDSSAVKKNKKSRR